MNCEQARLLMNAAIDGDINEHERSKLDQHIDSCEACTVEFEELKYVVQMLGEMELKALPIGFEEELHEKLIHVKRDSEPVKAGTTIMSKIKSIHIKKRYYGYVATAAVLLMVVVIGKNILFQPKYESAMMDTAASEEFGRGSDGDMLTTSFNESVAAEAPAMDSEMSKAEFESSNAMTGYNEEPAPVEPTELTDGYREDRLIIQTANLRMDVEKYDEVYLQITSWVGAAGGYIENESTSYKTNYTDRENLKYGYLTLRVPATGYESMINQIKSLGNVTYDSANAYDVTKNYRDTASEVENLKVTETRLREIMADAVEIKDILAIENELTRIRGQINSYERQLKDWEALADMTTITVELNEVKSLKPIIEPIDDTLFGKAKEGFIGTINSIKLSIEQGFIWVISKSPILALLGLLAVFAKIIYTRKRRKS
ncbi:MAG: DUF4349 domain-containing protein [Clostridiales bacterium]|nr:DUF4349 domain-containing protein [Clostridiales bacterium]